MSAARWLQGRWFGAGLSPALLPLLPLWALFVALSNLRRGLYRYGWLRVERLPVPVIVVGNITVGGAGKTPLTLWLARELRRRGRSPGIVSRGYGSSSREPRPVLIDADPEETGDEPLLLARRSGLPVWVGRDRAAAARALLATHPVVDIILCDDGLQHYRLGRDAEAAVFDGRGAGNGWRLPLGPLREPLSRLDTVDAVVCNGACSLPMRAVRRFDMVLRSGDFHALNDPAVTAGADTLKNRPLHAVAGIGDPERFFRTLESLGLRFTRHPFHDHHAYRAEDLAFGDGAVVLMTEKDAVKCAGLTVGEAWVLPVEADVSPALVDTLLEKISGRQAS
ncbi:MAG: lipid-A-disaccharide kinase [Rhodocyclaceae bacterium]|nr:lipid-A-disaccharide kinase [Rhodocyclaceae bacterium]